MEQPLPIEAHLDKLRALAELPLTAQAYDAQASAWGLTKVARDGGYDLYEARGFAVMFLEGRMARVHAVSLVDDDLEEVEDDAASLGIRAVATNAAVRAGYARLRAALTETFGEPAGAGSWEGESLLDDEAMTFSYVYWRFDHAILVALLNDEGDAHIGEMATADVRLAPLDDEAWLPDSVQELFGWPVE